MYDHERSLVQRLADKPFALIGVNTDRDRELLKKVLVEKQLTWRSFWNGGSTSGPISQLYSVNSYPSIFVLDHKGVIRFRDVRGEQMDHAVDTLLAELATEGKEESKKDAVP